MTWCVADVSALSLWNDISAQVVVMLTDFWPVVVLVLGLALAEIITPWVPSIVRAAPAVFSKVARRRSGRVGGFGGAGGGGGKRVKTARVASSGGSSSGAVSTASVAASDPYSREFDI